MKNYIALSAIGAVILGIVVTAVIIREHRADSTPVARMKGPAAPSPSFYVAPKDPGPPASAAEIERAHTEATLKSTYRNYRTAVATGNDRLRDALYPTLAKDISKAVAWAEEELARSQQPADLEIARKTLESLRK